MKKIILFLSFILIAFGTVTGFALYTAGGDKIHNGVHVNNIDLGGLTKDEAVAKLNRTYEPSSRSLKLYDSYHDTYYDLNLSVIDYRFLVARAVENAYSVGRESIIYKNALRVMDLEKNPVDLQLHCSYNAEALDRFIADLAKKIDTDPKDASISMSSGKFIYGDHHVGYALNKEESAWNVAGAAKDPAVTSVNLTIDEVLPNITRDSLENVNAVLGEYKTTFNTSNVDRSTNIRLASKHINSTLLMPGEVFSANDTIGARTQARGFKPAAAILNGEYVDDFGGGVCQVSTTLYNAVLFSNLELVDRRAHSLPSTYVPLGRDATINYGTIDFKFRNSTNSPIYVQVTVSGGELSCRIYGNEEHPNQTVKVIQQTDEVIATTTKEVPDPTLPKGEKVVEKKGAAGYVVRSWRIVYENGKEISREFIDTDKYKPQKRIVRVGTGEAVPPAKTLPPEEPAITV